MLSATILPGGISQAVGNAFPIFGKFLLRMVGGEKGKEMEKARAFLMRLFKLL